MDEFDPIAEEGADYGALILSNLGNSEDPDHQHICAVLGAMTKELRGNNLSLSPEAYFWSTVSSLDRLSYEPSVSPNTRDRAVDSLVTILSMVIPRVPREVLKKEKQSLLELAERVLCSKDMSPTARASGLICIASLLMVRDDIGWSGVPQIYGFLLSCVADSQSKVRRQSHLCLRDVLQSFQGTPLSGPASEGIKSMLERWILLAVGSNTAAPEGPKGAQEVLYVLDMLKECLPYLATKYKSSIIKFYKTLLEWHQPLVSKRVIDSLNTLCMHPTSEVSPDSLLDMLCSLALSVSTNDTSADSMTLTARLLNAGMRKIYAANRELCIAKLPIIFNALRDILALDYTEVQVTIVEAMKSLIVACLDRNLIDQGALDIKNSRPTIMEKICATIGGLLDYRCSCAWDMSLQVVSALFDKLGVSSYELLGRTLKDLANMQKLPDEDFPYRKQLHDCVGSALQAMGPEKFLSIIPLNLEAEDLSQANVWVFPILKQCTVGGSLRFYVEQLLDMAEHLKQRSSQLKSEGRVVSARNVDELVYSLWSLLPSFCNYPEDTAESFAHLKTPLCNTLTGEPDLRGTICTALQTLIQQNKNILSNNVILDGEDVATIQAMTRYTEAVASNNMAVLKQYACDMLSVLSSIFLNSATDSTGCLPATISEFASISDGNVISRCFYVTLTQLQATEDAAILNSDNLISRKLEELLELMIEAIPKCHASSKRHRLDCLYYIILHLSQNAAEEENTLEKIYSFLTEIILALKEANKKTRNRAFDILVQIGHAFGDEEQGGTKENLLQYFSTVAGGLAVQDPHMISAAVKGLARLVYEFSDLISSTYNLLPSTFLLLQRNNREISKACLGLMKALVAKSCAEMLQTHLKSLVEGLLRWPDDTKNHFKAKVKSLLEMLVNKCGLDSVIAVMPEEHITLLTNAANSETGSIASVVTTSRATENKMGTTLGVLRFNGGIILFMDSRTHGKTGLMEHYWDDTEKYFVFNDSNLVFASAGAAYFNDKLTSQMEVESLGSMLIGEAKKIAEKTVTSIVATADFQDRGKPYFGGLLLGCNIDGVYKAYRICYNGVDDNGADEPVLNFKVSDLPYYSCGSGQEFAEKRLEMENWTTEPTEDSCLRIIKEVMLFTYLRTKYTGGPTNIFVLRNGERLNNKPDYVVDPFQLHLDCWPTVDNVLLLLIDKSHGINQTEIEKTIADEDADEFWSGVINTSLFVTTDQYEVYQILCKSVEFESILGGFQFWKIDDDDTISEPLFICSNFRIESDRWVQIYTERITEERLEFIKALPGALPGSGEVD